MKNYFRSPRGFIATSNLVHRVRRSSMSNGDILNTVHPVCIQIPMDHQRLDDSYRPTCSQIWICESIAKSSLTILNNKINTQLCCRTSHEFHCRPHHLSVIAPRETNEMNKMKVKNPRNWFPIQFTLLHRHRHRYYVDFRGGRGTNAL